MRCLPCTSFFNFIRNTFGSFPVKLLKEWIKHRQSIDKSRLRIRFIKSCIQHEIVPSHLYKMQHFNLHLHDHTSKSKFKEIKNSFTKRLLRIELNDAHRSLNHSRNRIFHLVRTIMRNLPLGILQPFFDNHDSSLYLNFIREKQRIDDTLKWLIDRQKLRI